MKDGLRDYWDFGLDEVKGKHAHARAHIHAQIAEELLAGTLRGVYMGGSHTNVPSAAVHAQLANAYATLAAGDLV